MNFSLLIYIETLLINMLKRTNVVKNAPKWRSKMGTGAPMTFRHMIHGKVSLFYFIVASDYVNEHYYPD